MASVAKAEVIRYLMRNEEDHMLRRMADAPVPGKKRKTENQVERLV